MRTTLPWLAVGLLLGVAPSALAKSLSLNEVLGSVDSHYPLVMGALQDLEKSKGDLTAARGGFDPVLKSTYQATPSGEYENRYFDTVLEQPTPLWGARIFSGYRVGAGRFGPYDERMLTSSDGEVRAGVELPLLRGGYTDERRARIASGEKALAASHAQLELQRLDARRQASYRYYDWLASGEKLRIARILLQLAVDRDRMMGHRVKKGDAARIEQTDNQRSLVQRESAQITAQRSIQKAALELSLFYRDPNGLPVTPAIEQLPVEGMPVPVAEQSLRSEQSAAIAQEILPRHPDQLRLQAQIEQNEIERGLSKNSILPKLDAELTASQDINAGESKKSIFEYKAALKLEFPLLLRSGRGKFDSASAQGAKLGAQLDLARDRIRIAIQDALQAMDAAQNRIKLARQEVELSIQVEEAERIKFRQGDSNILTVNLRENSTADARGRVVDALADYYRARADFEAASAGQFRDR